MLKIRVLPHDWRCLTAGNEDDIIPLLRLFKEELFKLKTIDETNALPAVREALRKRKEQKADDYAQRKWGMSFAAFRKAKSEFPEDEYRADMAAIGQISIEADCLLTGFQSNGLPLIVQANGHQGAHIKDEFAVAGEGAWLAQYGLLHRDHYETHPLAQTVYCVYEAKKYAERVSSVGRATFLVVLRAGARSQMLTPQGLMYLEEQFQKLGPQALVQQPTVLKQDCFVLMDRFEEER